MADFEIIYQLIKVPPSIYFGEDFKKLDNFLKKNEARRYLNYLILQNEKLKSNFCEVGEVRSSQEKSVHESFSS